MVVEVQGTRRILITNYYDDYMQVSVDFAICHETSGLHLFCDTNVQSLLCPTVPLFTSLSFLLLG